MRKYNLKDDYNIYDSYIDNIEPQKFIRGKIRIATGVVLILMEILSFIGAAYEDFYGLPTISFANGWAFANSLAYFLGYHSWGIAGIILLIFGIRAYVNRFCSKLVLHTNNSKLHTVVKWISVVIASLPLFYFVALFCTNIPADGYDAAVVALITVFYSPIIVSSICFVIYLIRDYNKKPSCQFSATLIFLGVSYLLTLFLSDSLFFLDDILPVIFRIIPQLLAGILYIIIAVKLYKENFSVKVIKILGCITLGLEFFARVVGSIVLRSFNFYDPTYLLSCLFVIILFLYISVFKINTLKETTFTNSNTAMDSNTQYNYETSDKNFVKHHSKKIEKWNMTMFSNLSAIVLSIISILAILLAMNLQDAQRNHYENWNTTAVYFVLLSLFCLFLCFSIFSFKKRTFKILHPISYALIIATIVVVIEDSVLSSSHHYKFKPYLYCNSSIVNIFNAIWIVGAILIFIITSLPILMMIVKNIQTKWHKSIAYKEKCYKRVAKLHRYFEAGIITEEEYISAKNDIVKNIE